MNDAVIRIADRTVATGFLFLMLCWLTLLTLLPVNCDEVEHAHVAWLISVSHMLPLRDFFQHHQPVLWDLLSSYYYLGGTGPEVIYFGRLLVAVSFVVTILGLRRLSSLSLVGKDRPQRVWLGAAAILFLVAVSTMREAMFLARPETISMPLFVWSLVFWFQVDKRKAGRFARDAIAGVLIGLAVFCSPRYLIVTPAFVFTPGGRVLGVADFDIRRIATVLLFALLVCVVYLSVSYTTLAEVVFNLRFSALLQHIGSSHYTISDDYAYLLALVVAIGTLFAKDAETTIWPWMAVGGSYIVAAMGISIAVAGGFGYDHQFAAVAVLAASQLALWQDKLRGVLPYQRIVVFGLLLFASYEVADRTLSLRARGNNAIYYVGVLEQRLGRIPKGDTVLLGANLHPITVNDASYYFNPLDDSEDRTCRAIKAASALWDLPACNYVADINNNRPFLLKAPYFGRYRIPIYADQSQTENLEFYLVDNYTPCPNRKILLRR